MISIDISNSVLKDVRELGPILREADKAELIWLGFKPHHALYYSFKYGVYRKTARVNGKIVAMWGVTGVPMGIVGQPYLLTASGFEDIPILQLIRAYKEEVNTMLKIFPVLTNYVDSRYKGAIKLLRIAGFTINPPEEFGPNKAMFCKFTKRVD